MSKELILSMVHELMEVKLSKEIVKNDSFTFRGFGNCHSECKVHIWEINGCALVMLTDKGIGTSVTNASEIICQAVYDKYLIGKYTIENIFFTETYDVDKVEELDIVVPKWENGRVTDVSWIPTTIKRITR